MDIQFIYDAVRVMMSCRIYTFSKLHTAGIKHYIEPASPKESEVGVYVHKKFVSILIGHRTHAW